MKKWAFAAIFTLMTLFSACGENASQRAEEAAVFYSECKAFESVAEITMDHGDYVTEYVLSHSYAENTHTVSVVEPLSLSGLSMTFDGETAELRFKDALFIPPSLHGTKATPLKLLPDMLESLMRGTYEAPCAIEYNGEKCVSFGMWNTVDGEEIMYRVILSGKTLDLIHAEAFHDGRAVLTADYTEVLTVKD